MNRVGDFMTQTAHQMAEGTGPIVARYGSYYRNMRYIMTTLIVAFGFWFMYDGFVGYPEHNRKYAEIEARRSAAENSGDNVAQATAAEELRKHGTKKTNTDIALQKILGFSLPPLGIAYLLSVLYRSRGEYRLEGDTLHVPGHGAVPLATVTEVDNRLWERKGIATVRYGGGGTRLFKLDDFVYDAKPIRAIHERLMKQVSPETAGPDRRELIGGSDPVA
jgi:hypothetical protein